jgi:hypothetical protein
MKKLAWTALVTVVSAVASRIAVRALVRVWRGVTNENPPPTPGWMKFLVGKTTSAVVAPT